MNKIFILAMLLLVGCEARHVTTNNNSYITTNDNAYITLPENTMTLNITSPVFKNNAMMPAKYTCQGQDINPPLAIDGVPKDAQSLVLLMDDPDAPDPAAPKMTWDHWVVFNIPPATTEIKEHSVPAGAVVGRNSWPKNVYGGPCPPIGTHRYFFKLYALDAKLNLPSSATKKDVESAMQGHIVAQAQMIGLYKKT